MRSSLVGSLTLLLAALADASCMYGTSLHKRAESEFSYHGETGPLNWAGLSTNNTICRTGKNQSPINFGADQETLTENPVINIPNPGSAKFENLGSTVQVTAEGTTRFQNTNYKLKQFHLHTPSEHHIQLEYSPLELHMVHESEAGGQFVVLGFLFELSENANEGAAVIKSLAGVVDQIKEKGSSTQVQNLDLQPLVQALQNGKTYTYSGSLTTPPCTEGIRFLVAQQPLKIDVPSYNALKRVVKFNSRYTQNTLGSENLLEVARKAANEEEEED